MSNRQSPSPLESFMTATNAMLSRPWQDPMDRAEEFGCGEAGFGNNRDGDEALRALRAGGIPPTVGL